LFGSVAVYAQGLPPDLRAFLDSLTPEQKAQFKAFAEAGNPEAGIGETALAFTLISCSPAMHSDGSPHEARIAKRRFP
jgi:hypothetical protein